MLTKIIKLLIKFILEKTGLISTEDELFREDSRGTYDRSNTVDGTWREVNEDISGHKADDISGREADENSGRDFRKDDDFSESEPESLNDHIEAFSRAAEGIRHSKIREQAFHVLILARNIINEHETEHNTSRNYSQFERYYIPTVTSVVSNYYSIEAKGMATSKMQKDVLTYLESCGDAFTKMYNNMFSDDIMKMEVQMEAMDIIMKRDGLL